MPKRTRTSAPPPRLPWGGGGNVSSKLAKKISPKSPRRSNEMWTDQYAPQSIDELCVAPKKCKQVQEWLSCESTTVGGMLILVGSPGIGKSTMAKLICNDKFHEWVEEPGCFSPIQSFIDFLHQAMYLPSDTVVLLDDLPYLHNEEMKERFRKALGTHVQQCPQKTIWIYSQTKGGQHQPKELESLLDSSILYHSGAMTTILQIHPVTQAKMKKVLQKVCKANRVTMPDISMFQGDLRHALLSLQFSLSNAASSSSLRDTPLSPFHALGKLLYAKRRVADELESPKSSNDEHSHKQQQQRPPLEFVPEQVVEQSGMPLQASIYFLGGHAPDFFTDIEELSRAFGSYSDAAMFMQGDHRGLFEPYAISMASRAAATENWQPAATKFRAFSSPKIFEVNRKAKENRCEMEILHGSMAEPGGGPVVNFHNFITDHFPYLRRIHPHATSTWNLHSHVMNQQNRQSFKNISDARQRQQEQEEQTAILAVDDIEDFSSDDDKIDEKKGSVTATTIADENDQPNVIVID